MRYDRTVCFCREHHRLTLLPAQIHFGAAIPNGMMSVLRAKVPSPQTMRKVVLEGHRFTPKEALAAGLVDHIVEGNTETIVNAAQALAGKVETLTKMGAWGTNKVCGFIILRAANDAACVFIGLPF